MEKIELAAPTKQLTPFNDTHGKKLQEQFNTQEFVKI